jgi:Cysteine synthase
MASLGLVPKLISAPATSLLAQIGNTPLLKLEKMAADLPGVEIYGKAEFFNPGGSVKDRPALNMILEGERTGAVAQGDASCSIRPAETQESPMR